MKAKRPMVMRKRALRINQAPGHPLYLFSLTADELVTIADISRVSRDDDGKLLGYQRPEVQTHIENIIEYLESDEVIFPNSIILALTSDVSFKESRGPKIDDGSGVSGSLEIPLPINGHQKPAWIVDGQQRTMALVKSKRRGLPVPVNAFIADTVGLQRDQFLRINNTKPLPKGLIDELLPEVDTVLPANLNARKIPSAVCDLLNTDPDSPFKGIIRRASGAASKTGKEVVTDTVVINMLQENFGHFIPLRLERQNDMVHRDTEIDPAILVKFDYVVNRFRGFVLFDISECPAIADHLHTRRQLKKLMSPDEA